MCLDGNALITVLSVPPHLTGGLVRVRVVPSPLMAFDPPAGVVGQVHEAWNNGDAVISVPASSADVRVTARSVSTWATQIGTLLTGISALAAMAWFGLLWRTPPGNWDRVT